MSALSIAAVRTRRGELAIVVALAVALVAWVVTADRMAGMDDGPGTDLGGLVWFLGVWTTMMAAMMLPSAAPTLALFAGAVRARAGRWRATTLSFAAGYLGVWTAFGLIAYGLYRLLAAWDPAFLAWDRSGPLVAGAAVAAAGVYELSPLKAVCLRHCRSPLAFLLGHWRSGVHGAFVMGLRHGLFCAGCCVLLMGVLFAVGVMSITWMVLVAAVVFAEKVLPHGERITRAVALALVALGIWIAAAPGSVPGLTEPGAAAMPMAPMEESGAAPMQDGGAAPMEESGGAAPMDEMPME